jgi:hypothetical protein
MRAIGAHGMRFISHLEKQDLAIFDTLNLDFTLFSTLEI